MKYFPASRRLPVLLWFVLDRFVLGCVVLACLALLLAGCHRDPNLRKQKYFASGQQYFAQGKYTEASIQFSNAIDLDSSFADAHYQLSQTYIRMGEWKRAFQELRRAVDLQPENYPAHIDLANLYISAHDLNSAQAEITLLQAKQPDNPEVHLALANLLAARNNLTAALAEARMAVALLPGLSKSYMELALLQERAAQPEAAEASFARAIELDATNTGARVALGTLYASSNRMADAEQQFRLAMQNDPTNPEPPADIARVYLAEGKKDDAEAFLKTARLAFPNNSSGYRMLGDFYFATGEIAKAAGEYEQLAHDHPADLQVKKNYTQLLILTNRFDDARQLDDDILKAYPGDADALIYRAQIQMHQGDANGAVTTLQAVISTDPNNALAHYHLGVADNQLSRVEPARVEWQQALRINPDSADALRALAALALRQNDMSALQQNAAEIIRLQPTSPDGYAMRALSFTRRGQYSAAQQDAGKAISLAPQNPAGYMQLGNLKLAQKQFAAAGTAYQQALTISPESADALSGLMNTDLAEQQVDKALDAARAQIAKVPGNSAFYSLLGSVLLHQKKDVPAAVTAFAKAADLDKHNENALIMLAQLQAAMGVAPQAIATCQRALQDNPNSISFYLLLGDLYSSQHDLPNARDSYHKALAIDANNPVASNNLAYLLLQNSGDVDEAVSLAQTARRSAPESPNFADTLGWALYHKASYQQSIGLFQEAIKLARKSNIPDNPTVHYHLGLAYEKTGDDALARKELQRVLQLSPNYAAAAEVRQALAQLHS